MNDIMKEDPICHQRNLSLKTYKVIPMTTRYFDEGIFILIMALLQITLLILFVRSLFCFFSFYSVRNNTFELVEYSLLVFLIRYCRFTNCTVHVCPLL